jgi:hypothetical protein
MYFSLDDELQKDYSRDICRIDKDGSITKIKELIVIGKGFCSPMLKHVCLFQT